MNQGKSEKINRGKQYGSKSDWGRTLHFTSTDTILAQIYKGTGRKYGGLKYS